MNHEVYWVMASLGVFIFGSIWMFMALHYREQRKRDALLSQPLLSPEVREASHKVSNEATKLRSGLRKMADSPDPINALVQAMTGRGSHHHD